MADRLDERIEVFTGRSRTQATDAKSDAFTDLAKIFRETAETLPEVPEDLDGRIHEHCMQVLTELLGEPDKSKPKAKGGSK